MSAEFAFNQKDLIVGALAFKSLSYLRLTELITPKLELHSNVSTTAQNIEITPWKNMKSLIEKLVCVEDVENVESTNTFLPFDNDDEYELFRKKTLMSFVISAKEYLNSIGGTSKLRMLLQNEKKALGLVKTSDEFGIIYDILKKSDQAGAYPNVDQIVMQYPGSFCPFPHNGHLEVAQLALKIREGNEDLRVLVSTFTHNTFRIDQDSIPFAYKLDMLRRGFAFEKQVTILAVEGDSDKQRSQMEVISRLSSDNRINYVCGSDTLIKKVNDARSGVECSKLLISPEINFFIYIRKSENLDKLNSAIAYVKSNGISVETLEKPFYGISGTEVREQLSKGNVNNNVFTNGFVKELYERSNPRF